MEHDPLPRSRTRRWTMCRSCQYPLMRLADFDGTSSHDAPGFEARGANAGHGEWFGTLFNLPLVLLGAAGKGLWNGATHAKWQKKIQQLRADILPGYPKARICPHWLHVVFEGEL
jgi:hypothetical protein